MELAMTLRLLAAERRAWLLASRLRPASGQAWRVEARDDDTGAAFLAAARWAARLGAEVTVSPCLPAGGASALWTTLVEGARLQGLLAGFADGNGENGIVITVDGDATVRVTEAPDPGDAWRLPLAGADPMVSEVDGSPALLTCSECRDIDRLAIERYGVPGLCLMENAALAATAVIGEELCSLPKAGPVLIAAGGGNNGGDGLAIARGLREAGREVVVALLKPPESLRGDAAVNLRILRDRTDVPVRDIHSRPDALFDLAASATLVVDALLGTGFTGALSPAFRTAIAAVNAAGRPVVALDLPSGLNGDTGTVAEDAVRASATVTFAAVKYGLVREQGPEHSGRLFLGDIGAPTAAYARGAVELLRP